MNPLDEVILETEDVRVRILALNGKGRTAWHYHSEVRDQMLCLEGQLAVEFEKPAARIELAPGGRCEVEVGRLHRVVNLTPATAKYLLVQGVGRYDFNVVEDLPNA